MDPSRYFLRDPAHPDCFRWTQTAWEELGPRFARQGIRLDALRGVEAIQAAAHCVCEAEYEALTPEQRTDPDTINRLCDLLFLADPPRGVPPEPESRAAFAFTVREILRRLGGADPP